MPSSDQLGGSTTSGDASDRAKRRERRSPGENQMAVTAIDHNGRVVTVTSQPVEIASSDNTPNSAAFMTNIHGRPLKHSSWQATSWNASLRNHSVAVRQVIEAIASDVDQQRVAAEESWAKGVVG